MNREAAQELHFGPPRGMRDFYPEEFGVRDAVFEAWLRAAREFGFSQYDACVVESLELLKRKGGEEITEQIYAFQDKSGRALALRPEMTPTLARMIAARQGQLRFPLKWFAIAQCFRYERMSKGRKREHYQWNLDVVGEETVSAEAEIVACALRALELLGLKEAVTVRVSSRRLLSELLAGAGVPATAHGAVFLALDKRGKVEQSAIQDMLRQAGLDAAGVDAATGLMDIRSLDEAAARTGGSPAIMELRRMLEFLRYYGIGADMVEFDISVVRGLGYYTGIVFEAFDRGKRFRAIFGGGRYDNLLADLGGEPATAVGLGFGDVVVAELMDAMGKRPARRASCRMAVGFMDEAQREAAMRAACAFRSGGFSTDMAFAPERAKNFFSRASGMGAEYAVYIGPDDVARGVLRIKNMTARAEREWPAAEAAAFRG